MAKPLRSNFATNNTLDTKKTLFSGKSSVTTPVLTKELSSDETEEFFVNDSTGASNQGFAVIDEEVIFYSSRFGKYKIRYLKRGYNDTVPAIHLVNTPVTFTPLFYVPESLVEAVIAVQDVVLNLKSRVERVEALPVIKSETAAAKLKDQP
jgi:hypothetical protein